jgi:hypothetical protein
MMARLIASINFSFCNFFKSLALDFHFFQKNLCYSKLGLINSLMSSDYLDSHKFLSIILFLIFLGVLFNFYLIFDFEDYY